MLYTAIYLPVKKPLTDGCKAINREGEVSTYDESDQPEFNKGKKRAELFLVTEEFNVQVIVGHLTPSSTKWVQPGMTFRKFECINQETNELSSLPIFSIVCPTCKTQH